MSSPLQAAFAAGSVRGGVFFASERVRRVWREAAEARERRTGAAAYSPRGPAARRGAAAARLIVVAEHVAYEVSEQVAPRVLTPLLAIGGKPCGPVVLRDDDDALGRARLRLGLGRGRRVGRGRLGGIRRLALLGDGRSRQRGERTRRLVGLRRSLHTVLKR